MVEKAPPPGLLGSSVRRFAAEMSAIPQLDTDGVDGELLAFRLGSLAIVAIGAPLVFSDRALHVLNGDPAGGGGVLTAALALLGAGWLMSKTWHGHLQPAAAAEAVATAVAAVAAAAEASPGGCVKAESGVKAEPPPPPASAAAAAEPAAELAVEPVVAAAEPAAAAAAAAGSTAAGSAAATAAAVGMGIIKGVSDAVASVTAAVSGDHGDRSTAPIADMVAEGGGQLPPLESTAAAERPARRAPKPELTAIQPAAPVGSPPVVAVADAAGVRLTNLTSEAQVVDLTDEKMIAELVSSGIRTSPPPRPGPVVVVVSSGPAPIDADYEFVETPVVDLANDSEGDSEDHEPAPVPSAPPLAPSSAPEWQQQQGPPPGWGSAPAPPAAASVAASGGAALGNGTKFEQAREALDRGRQHAHLYGGDFDSMGTCARPEWRPPPPQPSQTAAR